MDMYNISHGFKQFTYMMAYPATPVNKTVTFAGLFGIDRGFLTVGNDGGISVWEWTKPKKQGFNKSGRGGRGGYRGRGRGQADQGTGFN
jgi:hypothetical protein